MLDIEDRKSIEFRILIDENYYIEQGKELKTVEQALKLVVQYGIMLKYVPEELKTEEVCLEAVRNSKGYNSVGITDNAIVFVPEALRTAQLCFEAVKNNGEALEYVPEKLRTAELCLEAVMNNGKALKYVPEEFKTAKLYLEAVKSNGRALEDVPEKLRTAELFFEAVKNFGGAIKYVPKEFRTAEMCLEATKNFGDAIRYVPEEFRTAEVCLEAVRHSKGGRSIWTTGNALEFVPEALKTAQLCAEAVKNNCWAIEFVPKSLMTAELCTDVVKYYGMVLEVIPEEFKTQELCIEAVKDARQGFLALKHVPEKFKTTELYIEMIKPHSYWRTWHFLDEYIPEKSKTSELLLEVVKKSSDFLMYVPEELRTLEIYIEAVKKADWAFMLVPENLKKQVTKATGVQQGGAKNFLLYKHESDFLDKDKKEIFEKEVERTIIRLTELCETVRWGKGLIALENYIDKEKLLEKDFLETGIQMIVDGVEREIIENYLDSWIEANCNNSYYEIILASIIKSGILSAHGGEHPRIAEYEMTVLIPRELTPDSLLPENEKYFRRPNIETIMQDMQNAYKYISRGLELFCYLELKMYKDLIGESINYDDEIGEINKEIANATEIVERLHILVPIRIKTTNEVLLRIKLWANSLDSNVSLANYAIFDLIDLDKWTTDIPLEYKKAYKELIKLVSWIYNISMRFKAEYNSVIQKTKDIFGKQLHEKALLPSATDNKTYEWITNNQFEAGMKSSELKPSKNDNQNKKEVEEYPEVASMTKQETGLPVNIFIDDGGYWLDAGYKEPRITFQNNYADDIQLNAQVPLIISEEPIIPESNENKINVEISERDLNMVKNFIRRYKNLLIKVGNPKDNLHTQCYFIKTIEKDLSYAKSLNIKNPWEKTEYLNNFDNELLKKLDKSKAKRRGK
ncbi:MAG: DUF4116 domain-containing protein [Fibromonadaceae bacterium]|jgi:hypothetical protein|nr:DUF4116 domain-containing protein [Fibromonadaceae bacterium]